MNTVELKQWGNSLAVRLPKAVLSKAGVSELPTKFEIIVNEQNEIILKKQKEPKIWRSFLKASIIKNIGLIGKKEIQVNQKKKTGKNQSDEKYFNFALRHLERGEVLARL